jgi:hypothetical protein
MTFDPSAPILLADDVALPPAPVDASPARLLFAVRQAGAAWELCFGGKGETLWYPTRIEAIAAAIGGACEHWYRSRLPTGVAIEGEERLRATFGA